MRAAELIAPLTFRLAEMPIEDPGPGEVQCRVESVGVCGSDLHAFTEGQVGGMPNAYPMVLGHEPAGVIVKTGSGVTGLAAGDRGALEPALYCYHCEFCLSGHHNVCANIRFLSTPNIPGFFRELVNLPVSNFAPIPANLSFDAATLAEPLAIAIHSLRLASISANETVAVIGAGPIGLLTIAALRAANAGRIWAIEPLAHRRELARAMGADVVLEPPGSRRRDPARYRATRRRLRHRLRRRRRHRAASHPAHAQRGPRRAHRHSLRAHLFGRRLRHAAQGTHAL